MGGMAIVRPALSVLGFSSGNSLFIISSFSPLSWTCLKEKTENADCISSDVGHQKLVVVKMYKKDE